jgi:hypothetical protein
VKQKVEGLEAVIGFVKIFEFSKTDILVGLQIS